MPYQGVTLDFGSPFRRVTMNDLVKELTGTDFLAFGADVAAARAAARAALDAQPDRDLRRKAGAKVDGQPTVGHVLNEMFEAVGEATLVQPTFVLEHPTEISPLAKPHRSKPGVTERCGAARGGGVAGPRSRCFSFLCQPRPTPRFPSDQNR